MVRDECCESILILAVALSGAPHTVVVKSPLTRYDRDQDNEGAQNRPGRSADNHNCTLFCVLN